MTDERKEQILNVCRVNLLIGFWNIYLYVNGDWLFNLIIGSLNISVWVFNRDIMERGK